MGYMSNKLVEVTEDVIFHLPVEIIDKYNNYWISNKGMELFNDDIFDDIMNFIMDNGDMVNDSAVSIAKEYTKEYNTKNSTNIKIE